MVTKNISMRFQHSPIKTVGGVRKSTKKCLKITSFWPGAEKRKIAQPRNLYPDATFTPIHLLVKFRDDRTSGTWSKSGNIRTSTIFCEDVKKLSKHKIQKISSNYRVSRLPGPSDLPC